MCSFFGVKLSICSVIPPKYVVKLIGFPLLPNEVVVVQLLSRVWLFVTTWTTARQASLSFNISQSLLKLTSIESVIPSNNLILCCPLLFPPSVFPSIRFFFKWITSSHQVAKVLEFQLKHQSFRWIFRTDFLYDWVGGSPCSPRDSQEFLKHPSSKASILQCSAFFTVQLSHPHVTGCEKP